MDRPRFRDPQDRIENLTDEPILVVCPRCSGRASVTRERLTCASCALVRVPPEPDYRAWNRPVDPYFREPLWLRADCCGGNTLWAFHERHLDLLERFVAAKLRERGLGDRPGMTLVARLPAWMTAAKHRDEVLRTIAKLRATLS
ncbi:TFIIB-type zinc ribbon-containing protein [Amycolatopsis sp. EV170708-02-1]|uniref:TFIIB-type zinc ribbon-containing protein n=1 Tax=Amycolatopsis sp. EV170708-02-1 TaxID=2919322 RepID=UPI001F0CB0C3|nr:TFIIB-type zinc ribbon-containing protein [Amycolatopsis sp. EV170708-02-1]UMP03150.1 TFIIB-type zinc ribbon-containing protein [Amycolatopsis sp. EV170708-02-1]